MFDYLTQKIKEKNAPVVVGMDPMIDYIPSTILESKMKLHSNTLTVLAEAFYQFNCSIIDMTYDLVPAIKLQSAMYEQLGYEGMKILEKTVIYAKQKGLITIIDAKRNDIDSTAQAYANAFLGEITYNRTSHKIFDADIITVNPFLGTDGILPFIDACNQYNKGIFILCKTSNPSSNEFQNLTLEGKPLFEIIANKINHWNTLTYGSHYKKVGAVVGATYPKEARHLRSIMPNIFFLVPGYGAQGASGKDLSSFFNDQKEGAIISASRSIMLAYKTYHMSEEEFALAARKAVIDMINDINTYL